MEQQSYRIQNRATSADVKTDKRPDDKSEVWREEERA